MSTIRSFIETVTELEPLPAEEKPKQKKFTTKSAVAMLDVSPKKLRSLMDDDDEEGVSFVDFFWNRCTKGLRQQFVLIQRIGDIDAHL